jgi:ATP-binding cassette subfamily B protein
MRGRRPYLAGALLLVATNALALSLPWLLRRAVDRLRDGAPLREIGLLAVVMAAAAALQALARVGSRIFVLGYARRAVAEARERLQAHLLRLPPAFYDRARVGDLMSRAINDLRSLRNFYGPGALNALNSILLGAAALSMMLWIDPWLSLLALVSYPAFVLVARGAVHRIHRRSQETQERLADLTSRVEQSVMGHLQIKAFSQEEREIAAFGDASAAYRDSSLALARARGRMAPLTSLLAGLGALAVLAAGGWQVARGALTLGDFVAFNVLVGMLSGPVVTLGWTLDLVQRGEVAARRLQEILDEPARPESPERGEEVAVAEAAATEVWPSEAAPGPRPAGSAPARGELALESVTFRYAGSSRPAVLQGVSARVAPGEHVGIVGRVGAGKSTLLSLLAGLYPASDGRILLDGRPISDWSREELAGSVVLAPQEPFLFSRSIADNVRLGAADLGAEEAEAWLRSAAFDTDLEAMPEGIDTVVGERGLTLSGGQRQRVALARTLAAERRVVLLDDPLSMVDPNTEARILRQLRDALAGHTVVIAASRPGVLASLDRIWVLDEGRIVEEGPPADLLRRGGAFARLALGGASGGDGRSIGGAG